MGSASDRETMNACAETLEKFNISYEMKVLSAHRTPEQTVQWVEECNRGGVKIFIAAAGLAAHLAGVVAAHTSLPVIGVPMAGGPLNGFDSLLSTVQMPKGTPVATVAVGKAGAVNAALLAARILGLSNADLAEQVNVHRETLAQEVLASN